MIRRLYIVLLMLPTLIYAQDVVYFHPDTTETDEENFKYYFDLTKKPDAVKAVWLGAIAPGAGQIYNGSYWKLPIVYGAFMGCGYAISINQNRYSGYKRAYLDLYYDIRDGTVSDDPAKSYIKVMPDGYTLERLGGANRWLATLQNQQNIYRRYRDYSILAVVVAYALTLIDAYVDAQLFDFDISPDLSMNLEPQVLWDPNLKHQTELKLAITF